MLTALVKLAGISIVYSRAHSSVFVPSVLGAIPETLKSGASQPFLQLLIAAESAQLADFLASAFCRFSSQSSAFQQRSLPLMTKTGLCKHALGEPI
jgi:hypothetical protein